MSKHFACLTVVGHAAIVLSSPAQTAPIYHLTDLGTLGGTVSVPTGINDVGQIVGYSLTAGGEYRATLFDSSGGGANRHLGTLGGNTSVASAINNAGQIVGSADGPDNHARATLFDSSGGGANRDLGTVDNAPFSQRGMSRRMLQI
jgi:probable HAF family extracellular repeat protein